MAACDPASLLEAARCFSCIPAGMLASVGTNLLCQFANLPAGEVCQHDLVDAWVARVVGNLGPVPSAETQEALCHFAQGLDTDGLTDKMIAVNCFVPDSLIAARTPFITIPGVNIWTDNAANHFVPGDLTPDGLRGDGVSKYLDTGINLNTVLSGDRDFGSSLYTFLQDNSNTKDMGCTAGGGFNPAFQFLVDFIGTCYFTCWDQFGTGVTSGPNNPWTGFVTGNRTAINLAEIYKANSANPILLLVATNNANLTSVRPNLNVWMFAINFGGAPANPCARRFSFAAMHSGLVKADAQNLFNRVQTLRQELGGGYV